MGFEPKISAGEGPQTCALDGVATGIGDYEFTVTNLCFKALDKLIF
jgi:hypothetical protein